MTKSLLFVASLLTACGRLRQAAHHGCVKVTIPLLFEPKSKADASVP
jgi:hypothetical protein